jgi:hypothetical protein
MNLASTYTSNEEQQDRQVQNVFSKNLSKGSTE